MENEKKLIVGVLEVDADGVMCDNGEYYLYGEGEFNEEQGTFAVFPKEPAEIIKFKCKPTFNFQSVEFEIECSVDNLHPLFTLYSRILKGLIAITPEQPANKAVPVKPASQSQIDTMNRFNIQYSQGISYDEANRLIQESMQKARSAKIRTY